MVQDLIKSFYLFIYLLQLVFTYLFITSFENGISFIQICALPTEWGFCQF